MCLCAALQANVIPKPDGMALHYIDWDEDDEVGTGDRTTVAGALQQEVIYLEEDLKRQEESNDLRRAVHPVRLMEQVSNKWAFAPSTEILPGNAQRRRRNKAPFLPAEIFVFLFRVCKQRDQGLFCNRFLSVLRSSCFELLCLLGMVGWG
jgi:hypothetical protein